MEGHGPAVQPARFRRIAPVARVSAAIPGTSLARIPDVAALIRATAPDPGLRKRACVAPLSIRHHKNLPLYRHSVLSYVSSIPAHPGGAILWSSFSRAGLAVDAAASAREVRAGRVVPVSPRLRADDGAVRLRLARKFPAPSTGLENCGDMAGRAYGKTVWSWPSLPRSSPAKVRASPTGQTASSKFAGRGRPEGMVGSREITA